MDVEIVWMGEKVKIEMQPITFGDLIEIMKNCTKSRTVNGMIMQERDEVEMSFQIMMRSIKNAPFEVNKENLGKLSLADGSKLIEVSAKLNSFQTD